MKLSVFKNERTSHVYDQNFQGGEGLVNGKGVAVKDA